MTARSHLRSYRVFLLRMWRERTCPDGWDWRFSLEDSESGRRYGFTSVEAVTDFLRAASVGCSDAPGTDQGEQNEEDV